MKEERVPLSSMLIVIFVDVAKRIPCFRLFHFQEDAPNCGTDSRRRRRHRARVALSLFCRQFTRRNFGSYHPGTGEDRLNYTGDRPELARYLSWKQERRARDGPTQGPPPPPDTDGRAATAKWRGDLLPLPLHLPLPCEDLTMFDKGSTRC